MLRLGDVVFQKRYTPSPDLAVALLATRQAYPERYGRLNQLFGRSPSYLSTIYGDVIRYLVETFRGFLAWNPRLNDYERLLAFGRAVGERTGRDSDVIWGFVDGTFRPTCRPGRNQRWHYSGHKKRHGFKFQAIVTPDGLVSSLVGPERAPDNDWRILVRSEVAERMRRASLARTTSPPCRCLLTFIYRSTTAAGSCTSTGTLRTTGASECSVRSRRQGLRGSSTGPTWP